ncbi:hypothetical protein SY83_10020 [Paenibacillus swuensis]|uniref:NAD-dependent epimerase/dehydratase domain-containing protein n=1 Tax=Paenibacillus swuensis TaxID=1178515 RepID=A0A172TI67_9BACL|nr:NAD-dependent epimerase/dehydratase family protein [Paenibacillus swuensis]ANE46557.1 hypothetical protein SY83_10020 [Paenibacillus swuensis]
MKAFVTGSTGLLGGNLVRLLLEMGYEVRALARSAHKAERFLEGLSVEIVVGDMMDVDSWANQMEGCDLLFHTAAYFRETFRRGDHWTNLEKVNATNTLRLFKLAEHYGIKKIVHTSTNAVIRKRKDGTVSDEEDLLAPEEALNLYGKSKIVADRAIESFSKTHDIPIITVLPAWMFGPGDAAPTGSGQLTLNFLHRKVPGTFRSGIDVVDARDVALAMLRAAEKSRGGERYIISGHYTSLEELFGIMNSVSGIPSPRRFPIPMVFFSTYLNERMASLFGKETDVSMDELRVMTEMKRTSNAKAVRELGLTFRPLRQTIHDTVQWYLNNNYLTIPLELSKGSQDGMPRGL